MAISLKNLEKNTPKPPRVTIHGGPGIGKTTFGAMAESPVFIQTEDGLGTLDVPTFPLAKSFDDVLEALAALAEEDHKYKTVVIDSLDWLEPLIWTATCNRIGVSSIEAAGYGKGYTEALTEWRQFFDSVTYLRDEKAMTIIMIAHSQITRIEDPEHPAYDSHGLKLHKRAAALTDEYSDIIGFASLDKIVKTEDAGFNQKRTRAIDTGEHVLHLIGSAAFTAKNRYQMPAKIPLDYEQFENNLPKAKQGK